MFLSSYTFTGPAQELVAKYHAMLEQLPADAIDLNLCVATDSGITVYDACPSRADFEAFSTGEDFAAGLRNAGLPAPTITPLGEVHHAIVKQGVLA
jgi:hypothetical protein